MTARSIYSLVLVILALALPSCRKMAVGYLDATHATFSAKELNVYRTVDDDDPHSLTQTYPAPWTSQRIQGVSGTNPVNYEFLSVDVADGGDAEKFAAAVKEGTVTVNGGTINLFPAAVQKLPNGRYTVNLRVYNEGYSRELRGLFTFIIQDAALYTLPMRYLKLVASIVVALLAFSFVSAQEAGIRFFKGTFAEALAEAQRQNKPLFVDFYATWCVPCKKMEKTIFTQPEVGKFFNEKFVNLQMDAEAPENVEIAKKYKVEAFPTLGIIAPDGKAIQINVGFMKADELLEMGKTAIGEVKGFEELYKEYRAQPNDLKIQQELLTIAPRFLTTQDGMDAEKWVVRVRKLYKDYLAKKMADNSLINKKDYLIISNLGGDDADEVARVVEYINSNLDAWIAAVGEPAAYYVIEKNDERMLDLVKKGDESYKTYLEKIRTDYKKAYDVIKFKTVTPYQKSVDYYGALFAIYKNKDVPQYIKLMSSYLNGLGEDANAADYGIAAQSLYNAAGKKLTAADHKQAIAWLQKAIPNETTLMNKINFLVMVGDSYRELKDYKQAREYYNQAYGESLQMGSAEQAQQMIQASVVYKLSTLELLEK